MLGTRTVLARSPCLRQPGRATLADHEHFLPEEDQCVAFRLHS
jgi:hypothetical protein